MDLLDRQIIELLREDGRRSNVEIARELGVSEGTVRKRVERLIREGAVRVSAVVDPRSLGYAVRALILLNMELPRVDAAARLLSQFSEVMAVYVITGGYDLAVEAVFESNERLMAFLSEKVGRIPGVLGSHTAHILRVAKQPADWVVPLHPTPVILVVDDDPDFVEAARMVLEREGYEVRSAANGQEALRAMAVTPPDLVILDIMMDGILDGWDASGRIRANPQLRHTPILVVSSITSSDYLSMFPTDEDHLIDNFLSKPVAPDALLAEVRRLLSRRRA